MENKNKNVGPAWLGMLPQCFADYTAGDATCAKCRWVVWCRQAHRYLKKRGLESVREFTDPSTVWPEDRDKTLRAILAILRQMLGEKEAEKTEKKLEEIKIHILPEIRKDALAKELRSILNE